MLLVRRMADKTSRDSLWSIWDSIERNPTCVSRADYIETGAEVLRQPGASEDDIDASRPESSERFTVLFGSGDYADTQRITAFKEQLRQDAQEVAEFARRVVAHIDPRGAMMRPGFDERQRRTRGTEPRRDHHPPESADRSASAPAEPIERGAAAMLSRRQRPLRSRPSSRARRFVA